MTRRYETILPPGASVTYHVWADILQGDLAGRDEAYVRRSGTFMTSTVLTIHSTGVTTLGGYATAT
ncbi:MAG: hypothetical protein U5L72_18720 [Bacteroidales bacterium]|nr:hypothetical protein [Bacteroidales bacterium]